MAAEKKIEKSMEARVMNPKPCSSGQLVKQETAMESDTGSMVSYMPGYSQYTSGTMPGVDSQSVGPQKTFPSSGYQQPVVSYASEFVPHYSSDSAVGAIASTNGNAKLAGQEANISNPSSSRSRGSNFYKTISHFNKAPSQTFESNPHASSIASRGFSNFSAQGRPSKLPSKVQQHQGSRFRSADLPRGQYPIRNIHSFPKQRERGFLPPNSYAYTGSDRDVWPGNGMFKMREKSNEAFEAHKEIKCGPRSCKVRNPSSVPVEKNECCDIIRRDQYNRKDFRTNYDQAMFFVIKSFSEDDVHKSIKYNVWASTPNGNNKLEAAFHDAETKANEKGGECPIFLFFSVNGSMQFVGLAEMIGQVDFKKSLDFWQQKWWNGFFPLKWHIIKDISNRELCHIILENNDHKPVTHSRDTQEIRFSHGLKMLEIFKNYVATTSILDDFRFYDDREKSKASKRAQPLAISCNAYSMDSGARSRNLVTPTKGIKNVAEANQSIITLTNNLTLHPHSPKQVLTQKNTTGG